MKRRETIVWVMLILLTSISFFLGEHRSGALLILATAGVKFSLVAWHFMDLRHAKILWSVALLVLAGSILAMGVLLA